MDFKKSNHCMVRCSCNEFMVKTKQLTDRFKKKKQAGSFYGQNQTIDG